MIDFKKKFRYRLSGLMMDRQVTRRKLAEAIGVSKGRIDKYMCKNFPSMENVIKIADYFGVSVDYLIGRTDRKEVGK